MSLHVLGVLALALVLARKVFCATSKYLQSGNQKLDLNLELELAAPRRAGFFIRIPDSGAYKNIIFINARLDAGRTMAMAMAMAMASVVVIWGENVFYICQINAAAEPNSRKKPKSIGQSCHGCVCVCARLSTLHSEQV